MVDGRKRPDLMMSVLISNVPSTVGGERITRAKGVRSDEARLDLRCPAKDRVAG